MPSEMDDKKRLFEQNSITNQQDIICHQINEWTNEHKEPFAAKYIYLKKPWQRSVVSQTLSQFISLISNPSSLQMTANYVFWYV